MQNSFGYFFVTLGGAYAVEIDRRLLGPHLKNDCYIWIKFKQLGLADLGIDNFRMGTMLSHWSLRRDFFGRACGERKVPFVDEALQP